MLNTDNPGLFRLVRGSIRYRMFNFMMSIIILLILSAILEGHKYGYLVINIASTIVFVLGIYAAGRNKRNVIILIIGTTLVSLRMDIHQISRNYFC
jgi:riboflavin transporter FmnP